MRQQYILTCGVLVSLFLVFSCKKKDEAETFPNNQAPYYDEIPTLLVRNYVNRLYIDLIGREPLDVEMELEVEKLRASSLSFESRDSLVIRLQSDIGFVAGDSSYKAAYYQRFYELSKARLLEGSSDARLQKEIGMIEGRILSDSLEGNLLNLQLNRAKLNRLQAVISSKQEYQNGLIPINEVFSRMLNNAIYDQINMNTFNFVRASFNDLFLRFPTEEEFNISFDMIEHERPVLLFGQAGQSKSDYISIVINSQEFYEGIIWWVYQTLLSREPTSKEIYNLMRGFIADQDLQKVQRAVLITDEYANFD